MRNKATISVPDGVYAGTTIATVLDAEVPPNGNAEAGVWVSAQCYQDGVLVYGQMGKVDAERQLTLTLGPTQSWTGGAANGTAKAGYWKRDYSQFITLAETTFQVSP